MATYYSPKIVTDGLVLCLDAGNVKSYSGSGTTWIDLSQNNNTGTLTNGPTFTGTNGGSIVFDGVNDYVSNSNFSTIITGSFTVSSWAKWTIVTGAQKIFHAQNGTPEINLDNYNGGSGNPKIHFYTAATSSTNNVMTSVEDVLSNTWYNIVGVFNNSLKTKYLYVNNILKNSASTTVQIAWPNSLSRIGYRLTNAEPFNGVMAQFTIYNKALSSIEISQNYNATKTRYGL